MNRSMTSLSLGNVSAEFHRAAGKAFGDARPTIEKTNEKTKNIRMKPISENKWEIVPAGGKERGLKLAGMFGLVFLFWIAGAGSALAQERMQLKLGMNSGMPVGGFKDYMGKNSFRGFHGEVSYPVTARLHVGLGIAYNDYYEKTARQLYETKAGTISAVISKSIQTTPIMAKANYELTGDGWIRPYVGLGAGVNLISFNEYLGEFGDQQTAFKLAVGADAGVNIPFNKTYRTSGINLGGRFNYMPYHRSGLDNLNNWGVHLGVYFPLR